MYGLATTVLTGDPVESSTHHKDDKNGKDWPGEMALKLKSTCYGELEFDSQHPHGTGFNSW